MALEVNYGEMETQNDQAERQQKELEALAALGITFETAEHYAEAKRKLKSLQANLKNDPDAFFAELEADDRTTYYKVLETATDRYRKRFPPPQEQSPLQKQSQPPRLLRNICLWIGGTALLIGAVVVAGNLTAPPPSALRDQVTQLNNEAEGLRASIARLESALSNAQAERDKAITERDQARDQARSQVKHHYVLRQEGFRTWRFDEGTGQICLLLSTEADWKNPKTLDQLCPSPAP